MSERRMRMKQVHSKWFQESYHSQREKGRYNPATVVKVDVPGKGQCKAVIGAGTSDDVTLWLEGSCLYVIAVNRGLDYCGVERHDFADGTRSDYADLLPPASLFFSGEENYRDVLGKRGFDLADRTIAKRLIECLNDMA